MKFILGVICAVFLVAASCADENEIELKIYKRLIPADVLRGNFKLFVII